MAALALIGDLDVFCNWQFRVGPRRGSTSASKPVSTKRDQYRMEQFPEPVELFATPVGRRLAAAAVADQDASHKHRQRPGHPESEPGAPIPVPGR